MGDVGRGTARAAADLPEGYLLATVEVPASPERVFDLLASAQVTEWWVRPGVFDTREWTGDVRVGGRWQASGIGGGKRYTLEGEFLAVEPPTKLVHTWHPAGAPGAPSTATYLVEPVDGGTRITLRQSGFSSRDVCVATCIGWETSFRRLAEYVETNDRGAE